MGYIIYLSEVKMYLPQTTEHTLMLSPVWGGYLAAVISHCL